MPFKTEMSNLRWQRQSRVHNYEGKVRGTKIAIGIATVGTTMTTGAIEIGTKTTIHLKNFPRGARMPPGHADCLLFTSHAAGNFINEHA
jgi:hypothetical protein